MRRQLALTVAAPPDSWAVSKSLEASDAVSLHFPFEEHLFSFDISKLGGQRAFMSDLSCGARIDRGHCRC